MDVGFENLWTRLSVGKTTLKAWMHTIHRATISVVEQNEVYATMQRLTGDLFIRQRECNIPIFESKKIRFKLSNL